MSDAITDPTRDPIRVLIIDDSALVRELLSELLEADGDIRVVGTAADPYIARERIKDLNPDVLTLDVEMPRMDGISFLRNLMRLRPMPVVMISAHTQAGAETTLEALALGAVDFVAKPDQNLVHRLGEFAAEIRAKVRGAASSRVRRLAGARGPTTTDGVLMPQGGVDHRLIALGASAGGTEAIRQVIAALPAASPPVLICQHLPALFTQLFARRLDAVGPLQVREAADGDVVTPGCVYVAPGDRHLQVRVGSGGRLCCRLDDGPVVNRHKPSVDVLFESLGRVSGYAISAALLTGMGRDGARGLLSLRQAGARTMAQDEATSLVWGMPGEAVKLEAAEWVLPLEQIARRLLADQR